MIYLGSPYSDVSSHVRMLRVLVCKGVVEIIMKSGIPIYAPIVYGHQFEHLGTGWEIWKKLDEAILSASAAMWYVKLPGWKYSYGLNAELDLAHRLKLPVRAVDPYTLEPEGGLDAAIAEYQESLKKRQAHDAKD